MAFPEPDRDAVPVRVVTNGQLADRAPAPAAHAETASSLARAHSPARSIPVPNIHTAPYERVTPDALPQGSTHPGGAVQSQSTSDRSTSDRSEQLTLSSAESASDPAQVSIPVSIPVQSSEPVLVVQVQLPAPVMVPVQVLKSIPVWQNVQPDKGSQSWVPKEQFGWWDTASRTRASTNSAQENWTQENWAQKDWAQKNWTQKNWDQENSVHRNW